MTGAKWKKGMLVAMALPLLAALCVAEARVRALAQDDQKQPVAEKKERAKPRGRLPAYFSSVVTPEQREKIYAIQARYAEELDNLQQQLDMLVVQRDKEVEDVLTPEQKAKVMQMRDDARDRRAASKKPAPAAEEQDKP